MKHNFHSTPLQMRNNLSSKARRGAPHGFYASIEALESRIAPAAVPTVLLNAPKEVLLGDEFTFTVTFWNNDSTPASHLDANDIGYGPYIDIILPRAGKDGIGATNPIDWDGISWVATAQPTGISGTATAYSVPGASGLANFSHPFAQDQNGALKIQSEVTGFNEGDQVLSVRLPYGSFTPDQPAVTVTVKATLSKNADTRDTNPTDFLLNLRAVGGFEFGNKDALNNPSTDPAITGPKANATVSPELVILTKTGNLPENETATGPNFTKTYKIEADIAFQAQITQATIKDYFDDNVAYAGSFGATSISNNTLQSFVVPTVNQANNPPNNVASVTFAGTVNATAVPHFRDLEFTPTFFIPKNAANTGPVINAFTGVSVTSENNVAFSGKWVPFDARDHINGNNVPVDVLKDEPLPEYTHADRSLAIQKYVAVAVDNGAAGLSPGDILKYTLNFQVSDYFGFNAIKINDVLGDGLSFYTGVGASAPLLSVTTNNNAPVSLPVSYATPVTKPDGTTPIDFDISASLLAFAPGLFPNGELRGGLFTPTTANDGATTGTLTFYAQIQDQFANTAAGYDKSVDHGDLLTNNVTINGFAIAGLATVSDVSGAAVQIPVGTLTKSVYAVNGVTTLPNPVVVKPGDVVTFRLEYSLPTSDSNGLTFTDFLPLPVFAQPGTFNFPSATNQTSAPAAGVACFGPTNFLPASYAGFKPSVNAPADGNNSVTFDFMGFPDTGNSSTLGAFDATGSVAGKIDLLYSVTATGAPFADGLFLTNVIHSTETSTNNGVFAQDATVQVKMSEPNLKITKGVLDTSSANELFSINPAIPAGLNFTLDPATGYPVKSFFSSGTINASNLLNSNVKDVDAGDYVTFAVIVENFGSSANGAFDIQLRDGNGFGIPSGFQLPTGSLGPNVKVWRGSGPQLPWTGLGSPSGTSLTGPEDDFFYNGIEVTDPSTTTAALSAPGGTPGSNFLIVTYTLEVSGNVKAAETYTNTANLLTFAALNNGPDFPSSATDTATVQIHAATGAKSIATTSEAHTPSTPSLTQVAIGEIVRYRLAVEVPEGNSPTLQLQDQLPAGMRFLNDGTTKIGLICDTLAPPSISVVGLAGLGASLYSSNPAYTPVIALPSSNISSTPSGTNSTFGDGGDVFFNIGNVSNTENDANAEYVVVEFNALVDNVLGNQAGVVLPNSLVTTTRFESGSLPTATHTSNTQNVTVVEPDIVHFSKAALSCNELAVGDSVGFVLSFSNAATQFSTAAFDVRLTDQLAGYFSTGVTNLSVKKNGLPLAAGTGFTAGTPALEDLIIKRVDPGDHIEVSFSTTLNSNAQACQIIENEASLRWTSLPGANGTAPSTAGSPTANLTGSATPGAAGTATGERDGSDGAGHLNDYVSTAGCATVVVACPMAIKEVVTHSLPGCFAEFGDKVPDVKIGEIVTYRYTVELPASLSNAVFTDSLPTGAAGAMEFVPGSVKLVYAGSSISPLPNPVTPVYTDTDGDGKNDRVSAAMGNLTVAAGGTHWDRTLVFEVQATVLTDPDNLPGKKLSNYASLGGAYGSSAAIADIEVVADSNGETGPGLFDGTGTSGERVLYVHGTDGDDKVSVKKLSKKDSRMPGGIEVFLGKTSIGVAAAGPFQTLYWDLCDGNDTFTIPSFLSGNHIINAGAGNDTVTGGNGNDIIIGGAGNDKLSGLNGRDLIIGGAGSDVILGGNGDDILIAGTTDHDFTITALQTIRTEWLQPITTVARIAHLTTGTPGGLNGLYYLNTVTVHDDGILDGINPGAGNDLVFARNIGSSVPDLVAPLGSGDVKIGIS